jgi:hypothetical protein
MLTSIARQRFSPNILRSNELDEKDIDVSIQLTHLLAMACLADRVSCSQRFSVDNQKTVRNKICNSEWWA